MNDIESLSKLMEQVAKGNLTAMKEESDEYADYEDYDDDIEATRTDDAAPEDSGADDIGTDDLDKPLDQESDDFEDSEEDTNTREGYFVDITDESPAAAGQYLVVVAGEEDTPDHFALATYSPEDDTFSVDGETAEVKYWEPLPTIPGADDFEADDEFSDSDADKTADEEDIEDDAEDIENDEEDLASDEEDLEDDIDDDEDAEK